MNKKELIEFCLNYHDAYEDYPFGDDNNWVALRHKSNKKIFAMFFIWKDKLCANLKCEPMQAELLRNSFEGVIPAYHMNKTHWNTAFVNEVPKEELLNMISDSYNLTVQKRKKF